MTHEYRIVNGFKFQKFFTGVDSAVTYEARPDDVFICTFPKSGTTWTQQIVTLILNDGHLPADVSKDCIFAASPFLEMQGKEAAISMKRPGAIKTHMSYEVVPKHPEAKYIIVFRNPKDVCVSFFHHHNMILDVNEPDWTFDRYFEIFYKGECAYGDYFDWVLSWWQHREHLNTLVLLYEAMKADPCGNILKIAAYLGEEYDQKLRSDDELLQRIVRQSSLQHMMGTTDNQMLLSRKKRMAHVSGQVRDFHIVRKGVVGDWRNHMTDEQSKRMDEKFHDKFDGTGLDKMWTGYAIN